VSPPLFPLILLPASTAPLLAYALRPAAPVVAPGRLTVARTALALGGYAVFSVELLSALHRLTTTGVAIVWLVALFLAGVAAAGRWRRDAPGGGEPRRPMSERWYALSRGERVVVLVIAGLLLGELILAVVSPPNTYDSQSYHLPKVEHWVQQHDLQFYPVRIHRQVTYAPGAEYLLLHLRLLTGGDLLYALVQWSAGLVALLAVTRLTMQLGGGRRAQLLAAFVLASTPAVVLESSSTQTDLVVACWVACLATLALDAVGGRTRLAETLAGPIRGPGTVVLLGLATGLIAVTKQTGLFVAAPLLLWWGLAGLRRGVAVRRPVRAAAGVAASAVVILALAGALTGPYLWRMYSEFGNPLGASYVTGSITMQRHDPAALLVNSARQVQTLFDTPVPAVSDWTVGRVEALSRALGVNPSDPKITFDNTTYPTQAWYPSEDKAAYPVQALLMVIGAVVCLIRAGEYAGRRRAYALVVLVGLILHSATVKWQPWGNRLFLYLVVLAAPLAGLTLTAAYRAVQASPRPVRLPRPLVAGVLTAVLVVGGVAGGLSVLYGWPRRLVGSDSVLVLDRWHARFLMRPAWADGYAEVGAAVRASGARRIGIVQGNDTWEYPWWLEFRGRQLVAMQSLLPKHKVPPSQTVDAVVCAGPERICREWAPGGWEVRMYGQVGWALPADKVPPPDQKR
jgi:4-amino-4-deoxy-L-arabinose transferase-like glycosyltransferase